jgi:hypothetical protein
LVVAIGTFIPGLGQRALELADDLLALGRRGLVRNQILVVQVDAVGAELAELVNNLHGRQHLTHGVAERIATRVANRPETEREVVFGAGVELIVWVT